MKKANKLFVVGFLLLGTAFAADSTRDSGQPAVTMQSIMLSKINPQATALWDITGNALDDEGTLDGKKISAEQWTKLLELGKSIEEGGKLLNADKVIAAAPGVKIQDEGAQGASTAQDVQRYLDAKPAELRTQASLLQRVGTDLIDAAKNHDSTKLAEISDSLDQVCENCHKVFWYPQEKR